MKTLNEAAKAFRRKFESEFIPEISERDKIEVAFIAGSEFVQRWIPVEEELPGQKIPILIQMEHGLMINGHYDNGKWFWMDGFRVDENPNGNPIYSSLSEIPKEWKVVSWRPINQK